MHPIYVDYNATTPLDSRVQKTMAPFWADVFGNPSAMYGMGQHAFQAIREARRHVAALLSAAEESEIVFTSGGTESNQTVFRSALHTTGKKKIITSAVEHSSVHKFSAILHEEGFLVREIPVDDSGRLNMAELQSVLDDQTALVSVMTANNETGILFPIEKISALCREKRVLFHTDATQAAGKIPVSVQSGMIDFLSLSAHKFYGPKGAGILYVKKGTPFRPLLAGGTQERGRRAGTENVPGIVGAGEAARMVMENLGHDTEAMGYLRDYFEREIQKKFSDVIIHGKDSERLPNTSFIYFPGVLAEVMLAALDERGIAASAGSACLSGAHEPSYVLKAMGYPDLHALSSVRFSFGRYSSLGDVQCLLEVLVDLIPNLRNNNSVSS